MISLNVICVVSPTAMISDEVSAIAAPWHSNRHVTAKNNTILFIFTNAVFHPSHRGTNDYYS